MNQRARNAAPGGEVKPPNEAQPAAPAPRYFEPLPLGANAFAPPMYTARDEDEKSRVRKLLPLIVVCVAGALGAIGVGVALLMTRPASPETAEPEKTEEAAEAVAAKPPVEPVREAPLPKRESIASAPPATGAAQPAAQASPSAEPSSVPVAAPAPTSVSKTASIPDSEDKAKDSSKRRNKPAAKLAATPSREEVLSAMSKIQPAARRCFAGTRGQVVANIVIANSGRVSSVNVTGMLGPVGSCVALAVRKAQFPKFTNPSVSIRYPMQF